MSFGRTARKWTTEEIDRAKKLDSQGALVSEIAAEIGRTAVAVRSMLARIEEGYGPKCGKSSRQRNWTREEHIKALSLRESGMTWKEVGNALGRSHGSVERRIGAYYPDGTRKNPGKRPGARQAKKASTKPQWCYVVGDKFAPVGKCDHLPLGGSFEDRVVP